MTSIQLDDAQLAQFTACGLIVVDGERILDWINGGYVAVAPELWRKLTDPCPTCGGTAAPGEFCPNENCHEGRQAATLVAACPGSIVSYCGQGQSFSRTTDLLLGRCLRCHGRGVVTLGRFTIRLLPVIVSDQWVEGMDCVELNPYDECWLHCPLPPLAARGLLLDPLPQPGQWAVQFEAVE